MTDTNRFLEPTTNPRELLEAWREMAEAVKPLDDLFDTGRDILELLLVALAEGRTLDRSEELDDYTQASPEVFRADLDRLILLARVSMPKVLQSWDHFHAVMGGAR